MSTPFAHHDVTHGFSVAVPNVMNTGVLNTRGLTSISSSNNNWKVLIVKYNYYCKFAKKSFLQTWCACWKWSANTKAVEKHCKAEINWSQAALVPVTTVQKNSNKKAHQKKLPLNTYSLSLSLSLHTHIHIHTHTHTHTHSCTHKTLEKSLYGI